MSKILEFPILPGHRPAPAPILELFRDDRAAEKSYRKVTMNRLADINANLFTAGSLTAEVSRKMQAGAGAEIVEHAELDEALISSVKATFAIIQILARGDDLVLQRAMREWLVSNGEVNVGH